MKYLLILLAALFAVVFPSSSFAQGIYTTEKMITVDTGSQTLTAWEGGGIFYQGYSVHGAYWHNNFGTRRSNGCVNLPLDMAQKVFDWAQVGTRVEVW